MTMPRVVVRDGKPQVVFICRGCPYVSQGLRGGKWADREA